MKSKLGDRKGFLFVCFVNVYCLLCIILFVVYCLLFHILMFYCIFAKLLNHFFSFFGKIKDFRKNLCFSIIMHKMQVLKLCFYQYLYCLFTSFFFKKFWIYFSILSKTKNIKFNNNINLLLPSWFGKIESW